MTFYLGEGLLLFLAIIDESERIWVCVCVFCFWFLVLVLEFQFWTSVLLTGLHMFSFYFFFLIFIQFSLRSSLSVYCDYSVWLSCLWLFSLLWWALIFLLGSWKFRFVCESTYLCGNPESTKTVECDCSLVLQGRLWALCWGWGDLAALQNLYILTVGKQERPSAQAQQPSALFFFFFLMRC